MPTKSCAYCGKHGLPLTRDHVFPANLYPDSLSRSPVQRLTVLSCRSCNAAWSDDEAHFRNVLLMCGDPGPLRKELYHGPMMRSFDEVDGLRRLDDLIAQFRRSPDASHATIFPGEDPRVLRIVRKSVRGLCHHHRLDSPVPDNQVKVQIVPFKIPGTFLDQLSYGERDADVVRYWYALFDDPNVKSAWLISVLWDGHVPRSSRGPPNVKNSGAPNNSLEPTWPARILELRSILALGWPGGSARGR